MLLEAMGLPLMLRAAEDKPSGDGCPHTLVSLKPSCQKKTRLSINFLNLLPCALPSPGSCAPQSKGSWPAYSHELQEPATPVVANSYPN